MTKRKRNKTILIRFTEEELSEIDKMMIKTSFTNREAFIRKLIFKGQIINIDMADIYKQTRLLSNISNNINQIAKKANMANHVYESDVKNLKTQCDDLYRSMNEIIKIFNI